MPDGEDEAPFELWWDGQLAWQIFMDVACPWKIGMAGVAGIDDVALIAVLKLHPHKKAARVELFRDVQAVAQGALKAITERMESRSEAKPGRSG